MDKIAYLIVTYNGENHIKRCIDSLRNFDKEGFILILDNNSNDNTIQQAELSKANKIIKLPENYGFGKANNIGLKYLYNRGFSFFCLVNQDLYFHEGDYGRFLSVAKQNLVEDYAIISPIHMAPNAIDFDFKFKTYVSSKNTPNLLSDLERNSLKEIYDSKVVNAATWVLSRKSVEQIGYFDPIFEHYGEDTDYIKRTKYKQLKIGVVPYFKVIHNRPQKERTAVNKIKMSTRIWAITFFKDLNRSLISQFLKFPLTLYGRVKGKEKSGQIYRSTIFFVLSSSIKIVNSRNASRQEHAFLNSVMDYE